VNSVKFRGNWRIPWLGLKFLSPQKPVLPIMNDDKADAVKMLANQYILSLCLVKVRLVLAFMLIGIAKLSTLPPPKKKKRAKAK